MQHPVFESSGQIWTLGETINLITITFVAYEVALGRGQDPLLLKLHREMLINRNPKSLGFGLHDRLAIFMWKMCYLSHLVQRVLVMQLILFCLPLYGHVYVVSWPYPFNITLGLSWMIMWITIWFLSVIPTVALVLSATITPLYIRKRLQRINCQLALMAWRWIPIDQALVKHSMKEYHQLADMTMHYSHILKRILMVALMGYTASQCLMLCIIFLMDSDLIIKTCMIVYWLNYCGFVYIPMIQMASVPRSTRPTLIYLNSLMANWKLYIAPRTRLRTLLLMEEIQGGRIAFEIWDIATCDSNLLIKFTLEFASYFLLTIDRVINV